MKLRTHRSVARETAEAARYYESEKDLPGQRFRGDLARCLDSIRINPRTYPRVDEPLKDREIRHRSLDSFPFRLIYEIVAEEIVILAVAHHSRRPGYWLRRQP